MVDVENYSEIARSAVVDTARDFHFKATTEDGCHIEVPFSYQIEEPGFRPYRAGKASSEELQAALDDILGVASSHSISIGIEGADSVRKLAIQMGLGVDCSNFAYRALSLTHERMGLRPYSHTIFRSGAEVRDLHATKRPSWDAKDDTGSVRELTSEEKTKLETVDLLDVGWTAKVFGKDPEFIVGSEHIADGNATFAVEVSKMLPGDLITFRKTGAGIVSHLGVIEEVRVDDETIHAEFWHSWHTRDFEAGIRRDSVAIEPNLTMRWSHEGLENPARYEGYAFRRPSAMAIAYSGLTS